MTGITGSTSQSNVYNGLGTRVSSTTSSVTRDFVRDGAEVANPVLSDGDAVYTSGISERRGSATTYLLPGLKNVDAQANASQVITGTRQYDAFGNVVSKSGTWAGPFAYAGGFGYQEDSTGFMLLGHRLLDPSTGRFLTRDPIQDGRNWYVYCEGNPVSRADPTGLVPKWLERIGVAVKAVWDGAGHIIRPGIKIVTVVPALVAGVIAGKRVNEEAEQYSEYREMLMASSLPEDVKFDLQRKNRPKTGGFFRVIEAFWELVNAAF